MSLDNPVEIKGCKDELIKSLPVELTVYKCVQQDGKFEYASDDPDCPDLETVAKIGVQKAKDNKWTQSRRSYLDYPAGFHCFVNREDAQRYAAHAAYDFLVAVPVKIKRRWIKVFGYTKHNVYPCYVCSNIEVTADTIKELNNEEI